MELSAEKILAKYSVEVANLTHRALLAEAVRDQLEVEMAELREQLNGDD